MSSFDNVLVENKDNKIDTEVKSFTAMLDDVLSIAKNVLIPTDDIKVKQIIFAGMGASGIIGQFIKTILTDKSVIIEAIDSENLPAWANEETLFVPISYSGNTYETISACEQALSAKCRIIGISSGGLLEKMAQENNFSHLKFNRQCQPRSSFPYLFVLALKIIEQIGILDRINYQSIVSKLKEQQKLYEDGDFHADHNDLMSSDLIVFYGNGNLKYSALRAKNQINENAKCFSAWEYLTESNHNSVEGLFDKKINTSVLLLSSKYITENEKKQTSAFISLLDKHGMIYEIAKFDDAENKIDEIFMSVMFVDYLSYFMAKNNHQLSTEVKNIAFIKEQISALGEK